MERSLSISNRRAKAQYEILETSEAGIVLEGPEVKSLRAGKASLQDSFARIENGEVFLYNAHISPYSYSRTETLRPTRKRKLLLKRVEIRRWMGRTTQRGLTLVPLEIYFNKRGFAKVSLALAKGKKGPDRREDLRRRDLEREVRREFKGRWRA